MQGVQRRENALRLGYSLPEKTLTRGHNPLKRCEICRVRELFSGLLGPLTDSNGGRTIPTLADMGDSG